MTIFKSYDIRGIYPTELSEQLVEKIGQAFSSIFSPKTVVVGFDMRKNSKSLFQALTKSLTSMGADVYSIGLCSTDMIYFAVNYLKADAAIMITASHNPEQYNGLKFCKAGAVPIGYGTGIEKIEKLVMGETKFRVSQKRGKVTQKPLYDAFVEFVTKDASQITPFKVVIDTGNGMGGLTLPMVMKKLPLEFTPLFFELDGSFPNHEANPLKYETLDTLRKTVVEKKADMGIAFDGDADRVAFVDEKGEIVSSDLITPLLAEEYLLAKKQPIVYDVRSSRAVREAISALGGTPIVSKVGHSNIKKLLREKEIVLGGELSGHYYFKDFFYCDSGVFAMVKLLKVLSKKKKPFSSVLAPLRKYFVSGEINNEVEEKEKVMKELRIKYKDGKQMELDGLTVEYPDWWFNVRASNTEPLLRLNVEANYLKLMEKKRDEVLKIIRS